MKHFLVILCLMLVPVSLSHAHDLRGMEELKTKAVYSDEGVMKFAQGAVIETMSFGFHDYKYRLQQSSRHFTKFGWASFTKALQKSRMIEMVEAKQQVISVKAIGDPVVKEKGLAKFVDGVKRKSKDIKPEDSVEKVYHWAVGVPVELTYHEGSRQRTVQWEVIVVVLRDHHKVTGKAIAINQWIALPIDNDR